MHPLVGRLGDDAFLRQQLDGVRDRLEQPERADAVRADPVLKPAGDFPLGPDQIRDHAGKRAEESQGQPQGPFDECLTVERGDARLAQEERQVSDRLDVHPATPSCSSTRLMDSRECDSSSRPRLHPTQDALRPGVGKTGEEDQQEHDHLGERSGPSVA